MRISAPHIIPIITISASIVRADQRLTATRSKINDTNNKSAKRPGPTRGHRLRRDRRCRWPDGFGVFPSNVLVLQGPVDGIPLIRKKANKLG